VWGTDVEKEDLSDEELSKPTPRLLGAFVLFKIALFTAATIYILYTAL
jgi:hypothetical protein